MFTGVTAGNTAFAESDDLDDILEDFCEFEVDNSDEFFNENSDLAPYRDEIIEICEIDDEIDREDAIEEFIIENFPDAVEEEVEVIEDYEDCIEADGAVIENNECTIDGVVFVNDEDDDSDDDVVDSYEDCVEADGTVVDNECTIGDMVFVNDEDDIDSFEDCVEAGYPIMESFPERCMIEDGTVFVNDEDDDTDDDVSDKVLVCHKNGKTLSIGADALRAHLAHGDYEGHCDSDKRADFAERDFDDLLDDYCELTDLEQIQLLADHPRLAEFSDQLANYCDLSEDEQDAIDDLIEEHADKIRAELRDYTDYSNKGHGNLRDRLATFCDLTAEERAEKLEAMQDDLPDDLKADHLRYCEMTEEEQEIFRDRISDRMDEMRDQMKDSEKHHDEKKHEKKIKYSDKSERLKAMIMDKRDISDEKREEIKMKFEAKFGEDSDKKRSEIKMKYKDHMLKMKFEMSDERKSDVHERLAEMKAYKAELREKSSDMTDEEKQQLREEFIEKAKDMQLAWISPRTQITAGVDPVDVECREGFSLVMKASNGVAMCLKADSALKMIDRGIVVPTN